MSDGGTTEITIEVEDDWLTALKDTAERHGVEPKTLCCAGRCYVVNNPKAALGAVD